MKTICLDNFFDIDELFWLYNSLLKTNGWKFSVKPNFSLNPNEWYGNLGNLNIEHTSNWFSYFQGMVFRINQELTAKKNTRIHSNIERIYINATNPISKHWLHQDSLGDKISILTLFTPQWQDSWQGSFFVDGEEYKMKPGRIILFDSKEFHTGSNPSQDCPYVRLTCNIVVGK
jgi:hypothetical protein